MVDKFLGIGGKYIDDEGIPRAKSFEVDKNGRLVGSGELVNHMGYTASDWINDVGNDGTAYFGKNVGDGFTAGLRQENIDISNYKNKTIWIANNFNEDIDFRIWLHSSSTGASTPDRVFTIQEDWETVSTGESKILSHIDYPALGVYQSYLFAQVRYKGSNLAAETGSINFVVWGGQ